MKSVSSMEDTLIKAQTSNEQLMTDYNQLRDDHRRLVDQMRLEEQKHLNELKERMLIEQAEVQSRAEAEKREMAQKHEREVRSLMEKVEQHIKTNSEQVDKIQSISQQNMRSLREHELKYDQLNEVKRNLEVENKEQRQKIELLSYELELAKDQTN